MSPLSGLLTQLSPPTLQHCEWRVAKECGRDGGHCHDCSSSATPKQSLLLPRLGHALVPSLRSSRSRFCFTCNAAYAAYNQTSTPAHHHAAPPSHHVSSERNDSVTTRDPIIEAMLQLLLHAQTPFLDVAASWDVPICGGPREAWRQVRAEVDAPCSVDNLGRQMRAVHQRGSQNLTRVPWDRSSAESGVGWHKVRSMRSMPGARPLAPSSAEGKNARVAAESSKAEKGQLFEAPADTSEDVWELPKSKGHSSYMTYTMDHPAREQDHIYYGLYRPLCATARHLSEVLLVPEAIIGIIFGYWWMNLMTMKTCFICGNGLIDGNGDGDGDCPPR